MIFMLPLSALIAMRLMHAMPYGLMLPRFDAAFHCLGVDITRVSALFCYAAIIDAYAIYFARCLCRRRADCRAIRFHYADFRYDIMF